MILCHFHFKPSACSWKEMTVQVSNCRLRLTLFAEPYKGNALVLAPLIPEQLLGKKVSMLGEQSAKLILAHTLWNIANVKICVLDIRCVGSAVGDLDPLVRHLESIQGCNSFSGVLRLLIMYKAISVTVPRTFVSHDFG